MQSSKLLFFHFSDSISLVKTDIFQQLLNELKGKFSEDIHDPQRMITNNFDDPLLVVLLHRV